LLPEQKGRRKPPWLLPEQKGRRKPPWLLPDGTNQVMNPEQNILVIDLVQLNVNQNDKY
jgi:hypothetical protein